MATLPTQITRKKSRVFLFHARRYILFNICNLFKAPLISRVFFFNLPFHFLTAQKKKSLGAVTFNPTHFLSCSACFLPERANKFHNHSYQADITTCDFRDGLHRNPAGTHSSSTGHVAENIPVMLLLHQEDCWLVTTHTYEAAAWSHSVFFQSRRLSDGESAPSEAHKTHPSATTTPGCFFQLKQSAQRALPKLPARQETMRGGIASPLLAPVSGRCRDAS